MASRIVGFVHRLREADLTEVPGVAETIVGLGPWLALGATELRPELLSTRRWGVVLSTRRTSATSAARPVGGCSDEAMPPAAEPGRPRRGNHAGLAPGYPPLPGGRTSLVVDGERFIGSAVRFARALRLAGLTTDLGAAIDFARALALVDIGEREQVRAAGAALFVRRRDDLEIYDAVFARFWRQRGRRLGDDGPTSMIADPEVVEADVDVRPVGWRPRKGPTADRATTRDGQPVPQRPGR